VFPSLAIFCRSCNDPPMTKRRSRQTLVLANATRLLNDARILVAHRSFASAFALAVLAVEEIGKALIEHWSEDAPLGKAKSASLHIQKQMAVSSLLVGRLAVRTFPEGSIVDLQGNRLKTATRIFNESGEGRLFAAIRDQQFDWRKQAAI
jgi:hypothetical protein